MLVTKYLAGEGKLPGCGMACFQSLLGLWHGEHRRNPMFLSLTKHPPEQHTRILATDKCIALCSLVMPRDICETCRLPPLEPWFLLSFLLCPCFDVPLSPLPAPRSGRQPPTEHSTAQGQDLIQGTGQPRREGREVLVRKENSKQPANPLCGMEAISKALCPES